MCAQATSRELTVQTPRRVVECSSELVDEDGVIRHAARNLVGRPSVYPDYYNRYCRTWSPALDDADAYVIVEYAHAVYASAVCVFETFNAGAVTRIALRAPNGQWRDVFDTDRIEALHRAAYSDHVSTVSRSRRTRCVFKLTRVPLVVTQPRTISKEQRSV